MPSLSFTRDHRGYEYTSVVHAGRRRGQSQTRILYWFRTPPGVRFGRIPIDEDAIRALEEFHPGLAFDWEKILLPVPPAPRTFDGPRGRKPRRARPEADSAGRGAAPAATPAPADPLAGAPDVPAPDALAAGAPGESANAARRRRRRHRKQNDASGGGQAPEGAAQPDLFEAVGIVEPVVASAGSEAAAEADAGVAPAAVRGVTAADSEAAAGEEGAARDDLDGRAGDAGDRQTASATPAGSVLGPEGLARLRTRYAEIMARITERVADPGQADTLRGQAERLNPDAWVTRDEVMVGLEHYEEVYHALRGALPGGAGPRRRGRARRHGRPETVGPQPGQAALDGEHPPDE